MRLSYIAWPLALALSGFAGWSMSIHEIPGWCTDLTFGKMLGHESRLNVLRKSRVRFAPGDIVPLDNADTVTRSVIYDLSKGPLLFQADVPTGLEYWSVSVFDRNTDTLFIANDKKLGSGRFSLIVRTADQRSNLPVNMQVVSPSQRGLVLVRAVMKDRSSEADVARTLAQVAQEGASIVRDDRQK